MPEIEQNNELYTSDTYASNLNRIKSKANVTTEEINRYDRIWQSYFDYYKMLGKGEQDTKEKFAAYGESTQPPECDFEFESHQYDAKTDRYLVISKGTVNKNFCQFSFCGQILQRRKKQVRPNDKVSLEAGLYRCRACGGKCRATMDVCNVMNLQTGVIEAWAKIINPVHMYRIIVPKVTAQFAW